jgi:hypothetical protein
MAECPVEGMITNSAFLFRWNSWNERREHMFHEEVRV